ncbi:hypothetical protein HMPREF0208_02226 [Citrobacter koseri]|nr:hypothetical protein HMPREF3207_03516 [Citrobacter koseri]KXB44039.1 hypothetical protein HMPREF0208_02226 [Citrobacter koseri]
MVKQRYFGSVYNRRVSPSRLILRCGYWVKSMTKCSFFGVIAVD